MNSELTTIVGQHFLYHYDNGWLYELYVKNATAICYRIHSGAVAGRWVTDQSVDIVRIGADIYKLSWHEPTGTIVCVTINLARWQIHGVIFFPKWVADEPQKTIGWQNAHLDQMYACRHYGPTYPKSVLSHMAVIMYWENVGPDRSDIIDRAPAELPAEYIQQNNRPQLPPLRY